MTFEQQQQKEPFLSPYNWACKWWHKYYVNGVCTYPKATHINIDLALKQYKSCGKGAQNDFDFYFKLLIID